MGINTKIALGIHAAVDTVSIALVSESGVLGELMRAYDYAFIENLMDEITTFSGSLGVDVQDIKAVSVVNGPGSYTGLRLSVSVVKSIAQVLGIPIYPIGTYDVIMSGLDIQDGLYIAMIPSRSKEVNVRLFRRYSGNSTVVEPLTASMSWSYSHMAEKLALFNEPITVVGYFSNELSHYLESLDQSNLIRIEIPCQALSVARYALTCLDEGINSNIDRIHPIYSHSPV